MRRHKSTTYGQRGGESPTAGKRGETIYALGYTKRVYKGQRWMVILQRDEQDKPLVLAFQTEAKALQQVDSARADGYAVTFYKQAELLS